jgi:hypothetical protein
MIPSKSDAKINAMRKELDDLAREVGYLEHKFTSLNLLCKGTILLFVGAILLKLVMR